MAHTWALVMALTDRPLTEAQRDLLRRIGPTVRGMGFYLGGGTAVAIRLGHRVSVDFDFLIADFPSVSDLEQAIRSCNVSLEVIEVAAGTVHTRVDGIKVSFLLYPYPLLAALEPWTDYGVDLASLEDLSCMKLSAVAQRGSRKDFIDVQALLSHGLTLPDMLESYRRKYSIDSTMPVRYGLAYFDDAEKEAMPDMLVDLDWSALKRSIGKAVAELR